MFGRRSHARFVVGVSAEAFLQVLRDVIVERADEHEIVAISREPAAIGEQLKLDLADRQHRSASSVCVLDSRPIAIDGAVFYRLRLKPTAEGR